MATRLNFHYIIITVLRCLEGLHVQSVPHRHAIQASFKVVLRSVYALSLNCPTCPSPFYRYPTQPGEWSAVRVTSRPVATAARGNVEQMSSTI